MGGDRCWAHDDCLFSTLFQVVSASCVWVWNLPRSKYLAPEVSAPHPNPDSSWRSGLSYGNHLQLFFYFFMKPNFLCLIVDRKRFLTSGSWTPQNYCVCMHFFWCEGLYSSLRIFISFSEESMTAKGWEPPVWEDGSGYFLLSQARTFLANRRVAPNYLIPQDVGAQGSTVAACGELCSIPWGDTGHPMGAMEEDLQEAV